MENYRNYGYLNLANEDRVRRNPKKNTFLHTLLFYILPFIIINLIIFYIATAQPKFEVSINDPGDYKTAEIYVKIKSVFPQKDFSVSFNAEPLEMTEIGKNNFAAVVNTNGTLEVSLTNINGMNKTSYENINNIDDAPPVVVEGEVGTDTVSVFVDDAQSGVDYSSIYAQESNGKIIFPTLVDEGGGLVVFSIESDSIDIHVPDFSGHESIATFTPAPAVPDTEENADAATAETTATEEQ